MEQTLKLILEQLNNLSTEVSSIKQEMNVRFDQVDKRFDKLETKLEVVIDQTKNVTEYHTETTASLQRIENEINTVETVTAQNYLDITRLKAIK